MRIKRERCEEEEEEEEEAHQRKIRGVIVSHRKFFSIFGFKKI